jgi:phosphoenolpyruvate carboxykinase (ATP)
MAGHPKNIIFLTCDAFGVLPPVARLSNEQAMYHFISGYTAKVAGTERGITEPTATFSACFGAAFLTHHPTRYADLLQQKLEKHGSSAFLVNSGWAGGPYGIGNRMSIATTRACVEAILSGSIADADFVKDPVFGFDVPKELDGVDSAVLNARSAWANPIDYDETRNKLAKMYVKNFEKYAGKGTVDYTQFGPKVE